MQGVINAVLNTVFVSIPEIFLWCVMVLLFMKRRDLLDIYRWKQNVKKLLPIVILVAISINIMRYIMHTNNLMNFIIIEAMMCILMIDLINRNNFLNEKINYLKIIIYVLLADFILIITTESLCVLVVVSILNMTIDAVNNNIWLNIGLSLLPRILQVLFISYYVYKQNVGRMINHVELILKNRVLSISMSIFLLTVFISNYALERFIMSTNYLNNYIISLRVVLVILMILIPVIIISSYIISIYNLLWINVKIQREKDNMLNNI